MIEQSQPDDELSPALERAEDARMAELLAKLDDDTAAVDRRKLAELRGHSTAVFARGGAPVELEKLTIGQRDDP